MKALVQTYRLGTSSETDSELEAFDESRIEVISDQTARTIASWYHSPGRGAENITRLSHGMEFDIGGLREELETNKLYPNHYVAMVTWLDHLQALLEN